MSIISKDDLTSVIRDVIVFSEDDLKEEETEVFRPKLVHILQKVLQELIFVCEENIELLMECRNDMHEYVEAMPGERIKQEGVYWSNLQLRLDNLISKMQLCVLLEKLKAWCV